MSWTFESFEVEGMNLSMDGKPVTAEEVSKMGGKIFTLVADGNTLVFGQGDVTVNNSSTQVSVHVFDCLCVCKKMRPLCGCEHQCFKFGKNKIVLFCRFCLAR
jgi:hypothetical protein